MLKKSMKLKKKEAGKRNWRVKEILMIGEMHHNSSVFIHIFIAIAKFIILAKDSKRKRSVDAPISGNSESSQLSAML